MFSDAERILPMRLLVLALPLVAFGSAAIAQTVSEDPYIWLDEKDSPRSLAWVEAHNAVTVKRLEADQRYTTLYD